MSFKAGIIYRALFLSNNHSTPAHALGAFCGSVAPQAGLQQIDEGDSRIQLKKQNIHELWRSHIAAKKRRQRRCMSKAQRP